MEWTNRVIIDQLIAIYNTTAAIESLIPDSEKRKADFEGENSVLMRTGRALTLARRVYAELNQEHEDHAYLGDSHSLFSNNVYLADLRPKPPTEPPPKRARKPASF